MSHEYRIGVTITTPSASCVPTISLIAQIQYFWERLLAGSEEEEVCNAVTVASLGIEDRDRAPSLLDFTCEGGSRVGLQSHHGDQHSARWLIQKSTYDCGGADDHDEVCALHHTHHFFNVVGHFREPYDVRAEKRAALRAARKVGRSDVRFSV